MNYPRIIFVLLTAVLFSATTHAGKKEERKAKQAFKQGVKLFEIGEFELAVEKFTHADELNPSWRIYYNIGQCNAALKKYGPALDAFEEYLAKGGDEIPTKRKDEVFKELERLQRMVGTVEFKGPDGANVFIDESMRGTLPLSGKLRVSAGVDHDLRVVLNDEDLLSRKMRLGGGESIVIDTKEKSSEPVVAEVSEPEETNDTEVKSGSAKKTTGWILVGTGAALLVGGGITGGLALGKNNEVKDNCGGGECLPKYHDTVDSRDALATTTTVLLGVGLGAATVGVLLLTVFNDEEPNNSANVSILPSVGKNSAAANFSWRF